MKKIVTGLAALLCLLYSPLYAQRETQNWFFGNNAALNFAGGAPATQAGSSMATYEAAATVSDASGTLQFYTNSVNVWNRNHQLMTNGQNLGGHESATQGAVIVRNPANAAQYYVFVVDGCDNALVGGTKYSIIDMTQQNGLGSVTTRTSQLSTISVTEKLTAVRHANGRDTWIVVHGWENNTFYAYLLSPAGISTTPVTTSIGSVHSGGGGALRNANAVGYMKASPAGNKLALAKRDGEFELFDFNTSTGQLSNYAPLGQFYRSYGVEFSPDGSRLYGTTLDGNRIYQYNVLAGSASAIAASATLVGTSTTTIAYTGALQLGTDGKMYVALYNSSTLGVIDNPNTLGTGCGYRSNGPSLGGRLSQLGLPNFPNAQAIIANEWTGAVSTTYTDPVNWSAGLVPGSTDDVVIKATAIRMPVLSTSAATRSFTVENGASMTVNGTLAVGGNLLNNGAFTGSGELQMVEAGSHSIDGQQIVSIRNLTLATGATTQLNVALVVSGVLTLNANLNTPLAAVVLASSATGTAMVVNNGSFAVVGRAVMQRYIAPGLNGGLGYRHYSTPMSNSTLADLTTAGFSPVFNADYNTAAQPGTVTPFPTVFGYEQQRLAAASAANGGFNAGWFSPAASTAAMSPGMGYTVNLDAANLVEFDGSLNNGPITRGGLTRTTDAEGGWHLLGNPYPAPIDWNLAFASATNLLNSVYVFKSAGQYDGSYSSYVNGVGDARYLAAGQGFFVRVSSPGATGSLNFTNNARLTSYLSPDFNRATAETRPLVQLDLVSGPRHDAAYVYFEAGATTSFDAAFDAYKITTGEVPALSVQTGAEPLSISGLPNTLGTGTTTTVPLTLYTPQAGTYTLQAAQLLNLPAGTTAFLRDTQTNTLTNLRQQAAYTFTAGAGQLSSTRFALVFGPAQVLNSAPARLSEQLTLYPNPARTQVACTLPAALRQQALTITILNTLGQTVLRQSLTVAQTGGAPVLLPVAGLPKGFYTVQLTGAAGTASQKLVVE